MYFKQHRYYSDKIRHIVTRTKVNPISVNIRTCWPYFSTEEKTSGNHTCMTIWHFYISTSKINNNCTLAAFQHNVIFSRCMVRHSISNSKCKRLHTLYVYFRQTRIDTTAYFIRSNIFQCDCAAWWRSRVRLFSQSFLSFSLQSFCAFSFAKTRIFTQIYKIVCSFHSETHSMRCVFFSALVSIFN